MNSLRNRVRLVFIAVAVLLGLTVLLGSMQYAKSVQYSKLLTENERLLFRFSTLRESITEALISDDQNKLLSSIPDLEKLHIDLRRMQENPTVPAEFKIVLADGVDIAGVVILIRQIGPDGENGTFVQHELRLIADHLLKYDRLIVGQVRSSMLDLQMLIIGFMGIVISIISFSLIMLYRNGINPLLSISKQLELHLEQGESEPITYPPYTGEEVVRFAETVQELVQQSPKTDTIPTEVVGLGTIVNETTNRLNGIINYAQILADSDKLEQAPEEIEIVEKIIESGTDIANNLQVLTGGKYDGQNSGS